MADDDFEEQEDDVTGEEVQSKNPGREYQRDLEKKNRKLQDEADRSKALVAEGEAAKKENAFLKAGIDTEKGVGKLFFKSYDGELNADAIKAAATADGLDLVPTSQQADVQQELNDLASTSRIASSSAGSTPPSEIAQIKGAKTAQEVIALARKAGSDISTEQPWGLTSL